MFRAFKTATRYVYGKKVTLQLDINAQVTPPAKIDIVIYDDEHGITLRLNQETTSPRAFFLVSFANGLPGQLKSATESYCKAVGMKNLSSEKNIRSIVSHMAYGDSYTSNYFSLYFATLENCMNDYLKIEDRTSSEYLKIKGMFDSLRHHLGLPNKDEEVDYYLLDAEHYSQLPSDSKKFTVSANHAISLLLLSNSKTTSDFKKLSHVYECLAKVYHDNEKLLSTFNFAKDFFAGGEIDMIAFKELNFYYHQSGLNSPEHLDMYIQILKSIEANYTHKALPHSAFKDELENGDYMRFSTVLKQWEAVSLLGSSRISTSANSIFNTKLNINQLQQSQNADSALEFVNSQRPGF